MGRHGLGFTLTVYLKYVAVQQLVCFNHHVFAALFLAANSQDGRARLPTVHR